MRWRRFRRWLLWLLLLLIVAGSAGYLYLTRPAALRAKLLGALAAAGFEGLDAGRVRFSLWGVLRAEDVTLGAYPGVRTVVPVMVEGSAAPLVQAGKVDINLNLTALIWGRLEVDELRLAGVRIVIGLPAEARTSEDPPVELSAALRVEASPNPQLPPIRVVDADVRIYNVTAGQGRLAHRRMVSVHGRPQGAGSYLFTATDLSSPGPEMTCAWEADTHTVKISGFASDLTLLARLADADDRWYPRFAPAGRLLIEELAWRWSGDEDGVAPRWSLADAELAWTDGRIVLPLEGEEGGWPRGAVAGPFVACEVDELRVSFRGAPTGAVGVWSVRGAGRWRTGDWRFESEVRVPAWYAWREAEIASAEAEFMNIPVPCPEVFPAFVRSPQLPGALKALFRDYAPAGAVDLRLALHPAGYTEDAAQGVRERLELEVRPRSASCEVVHFPYRVEELTGLIRMVAGRIELLELRGRRGSAELVMTGVIADTSRETGFDLEVRASAVPLDAALYAALPERYQGWWQQAEPTGTCAAMVRIRRPPGSPETGPLLPEVQVTTELKGAGLALGDGSRIEEAHGRLRIDADGLEIEELAGRWNDAELRLAGRVLPGADGSEIDVDVEVYGLSVERAVQLPGGGEYEFTGRVDATTHLRRTAGKGAEESVSAPQPGLVGFEDDYRAEVRTGVLRSAAGSWQVVRGTLERVAGVERLRDLGLEQSSPPGPARAELAGRWSAAGGVEFLLDASAADMGALLGQVIAADWLAGLGFAGPGTLRVQSWPLDQDRSALGAQVYAAFLHGTWLPLKLWDVKLTAELEREHLRVPQAQARIPGGGYVRLWQEEAGRWDGEARELDWKLQAHEVVVDATVRPWRTDVQVLMDKLALTARFDLGLDRLHLRWNGDEMVVAAAGELDFRDSSLWLGLTLDRCVGKLTGGATFAGGTLATTDTTLELTTGRIAGRAIQDLQTRLVYPAWDGSVELLGLRGTLCGGQVRGSLRLDPPAEAYELLLQLHDVAAAELWPTVPDGVSSTPPKRGRIDGDIWLRGQGNTLATCGGGGVVRLRGAALLGTPVIMRLFTVAQAEAGDELDEAAVRFRWMGTRIECERIDIRSPLLRFVGSGTWDIETDTLDLTLWGAPPERWPRLLLLSTLVDLAGQELVQYRVRGTVAAPEITVEPLHRVGRVLGQMLEELRGLERVVPIPGSPDR
ncbi:MAG: hypothetical protein IPM18_08035 [Phycisphaerales bacterium]|nr:hypothetical protein [Phycisphaerales bacterium]